MIRSIVLIAVASSIISALFDSSLTKIDTIYIISIVLLVNETIKAIIDYHKKIDIVYNKAFFKYAGEMLGGFILIIVYISLVVFGIYYLYISYMRG